MGRARRAHESNGDCGASDAAPGRLTTPSKSETIHRFQRFPSLDGWRAVSILLVLAAHCRLIYNFPDWLHPDWADPLWNAGNMGVRFFFVISGFLITYLLIQEHEKTGQVSLKGFYIRRALRILPVYFAFLLVIGGLQYFTKFHLTPADWLRNATFTADFHPASLTTAHLWSLSVEEQFYLIWPLTFVLIGLTNKRRLCLFLALPILLCPVCRLISVTNMAPAVLYPFFQTYSFLNYFDNLCIGCLAAILLVRYERQIAEVMGHHPFGFLFLSASFVVLPGVLTHGWHKEAIALSASFQATGFALLLLQSVLFPNLFKPLNWPIMQRIGILSYSVYIWQGIFCTDPKEFGFSRVWWVSFPGWVIPVFVVAAISYYGFEKPLMGMRARFRKVELQPAPATERSSAAGLGPQDVGLALPPPSVP